MPRTRRAYPPEFRQQIVELHRAGRSPGELAREFEPNEQTIRNWIAQADLDEGRRRDGLTTVERAELRKLRKENRQLRVEREILAKARGLVRTGERSDFQGVFRFVKVNQADYPITTMCRLLGVSTSGYYAWVDRGPSTRDEANARLLETINGIHQQSRRTYGAPRITAELREEGHLVGKNRVARLMKVAGIEGVSRRRKTRTTLRGQDSRPAPDLVERNFQVSRPNRLWVADITYVPSWAGFVYLAVVVDAFSRRVVGWSLRNDLKTRLVTDALQMALQERESDGVIHHSDQGTQYTSIEFGLRCKRAGIRPSMGSVGDCYDNALCESFFASLECELIDRHSFRSKLQAKLAVFDYIEGFYNPHRRHSSLDYLSPINYESRHSDVA